MKKVVLMIFLSVSMTGTSFSQLAKTGDTGTGRTFLKRVENNLLSGVEIYVNGKISRVYNLQGKTDTEKLLFGDTNAMVEFFVEPPSGGAYGFRVVKDSSRAGHLLEYKHVANREAVASLDRYKVGEQSLSVSNLFAGKLHETVSVAIKNFVMKGDPAGILDGNSVTFRCVVGDEVWTLTIHAPDNELLRLTNLCDRLIDDVKANRVNESNYIFEDMIALFKDTVVGD
jgi:hypothetical protein